MAENIDSKEQIQEELNDYEKELDKSGNLTQLVTFKVDEELYGLEILKIQEIVRLPDITRLPKASEFIKGVINLRGNIVPVIDLRQKFGLPSKRYSKMTRAIVVEVKGKKIALIVDEVAQVVRMDSRKISDAPTLVSKIAQEYIEGVARLENQLILILKIDQILSNDEIIEIEKLKKE